MGIAALKQELLRELAVTTLSGTRALAGARGWGGGSTDLINWPNFLNPRDRARLLTLDEHGPGLFVRHVHDGDRIWLGPGSVPAANCYGTFVVRVVDTVTVISPPESAELAEASRRVCMIGVFEHRLAPDRKSLTNLLEAILDGHVQDA